MKKLFVLSILILSIALNACASTTPVTSPACETGYTPALGNFAGIEYKGGRIGTIYWNADEQMLYTRLPDGSTKDQSLGPNSKALVSQPVPEDGKLVVAVEIRTTNDTLCTSQRIMTTKSFKELLEQYQH